MIIASIAIDASNAWFEVWRGLVERELRGSACDCCGFDKVAKAMRGEKSFSSLSSFTPCLWQDKSKLCTALLLLCLFETP